MCVMEIHPDAAVHAMLQACAHNVSTILRDMEMLRPTVETRQPENLAGIDRIAGRLGEIYAELIAHYRDAVHEHLLVSEPEWSAQGST
jgi:hypothetical protein